MDLNDPVFIETRRSVRWEKLNRYRTYFAKMLAWQAAKLVACIAWSLAHRRWILFELALPDLQVLRINVKSFNAWDLGRLMQHPTLESISLPLLPETERDKAELANPRTKVRINRSYGRQ